MKTTIELPDELVRSAKAHAAKQNITLQELIERGLRLVIREGQSKHEFELRDVSVNGDGLNPELIAKDWDEIRALSYRR